MAGKPHNGLHRLDYSRNITKSLCSYCIHTHTFIKIITYSQYVILYTAAVIQKTENWCYLTSQLSISDINPMLRQCCCNVRLFAILIVLDTVINYFS